MKLTTAQSNGAIKAKESHVIVDIIALRAGFGPRHKPADLPTGVFPKLF